LRPQGRTEHVPKSWMCWPIMSVGKELDPKPSFLYLRPMPHAVNRLPGIYARESSGDTGAFSDPSQGMFVSPLQNDKTNLSGWAMAAPGMNESSSKVTL
jgi:hypothetical protein